MPYLSHSQMETWGQCRRRWFLQKIEGAPQAPSEALIVGTAVHSVIEEDGRDLMRGAVANDAQLQERLENELTRTLATDDPAALISPDAAHDMWQRGRAIIAAYAAHLRPRYMPLAVEESFTVGIPGADGWHFTGRIDARARLADGSLAIIDFKTGKSWDKGIEHTKPQASAYLMADSMRPPLQQAQAVCFAVFPTESDGDGGYVSRPQFRVTTRTTAQIDAYARSLVITTEQITAARRSGEFPTSTGPLCGWCSTLSHCREGRDWLKSHGRKPAVPVFPILEAANE